MAEKQRSESIRLPLKRSVSNINNQDVSNPEDNFPSKKPRYAISTLNHALSKIRNALPHSYPDFVVEPLIISSDARCFTFGSKNSREQCNSTKHKNLALKDKLLLNKSYHEDLSELFFLQNLGHSMTEYSTWKKKPDVQLSQFLQANPLDRSNRNSFVDINPVSEKDGHFSNFSSRKYLNSSSPNQFGFEKVPSGSSTPTIKGILNTNTLDVNKIIAIEDDDDDNINENSAGNEIAEQARKEAEVIKRVHLLRKQGLWTKSRLPKCMEPKRIKTHWDYLLEEMQWMAADFASEAKLKQQHAKRQARAIQAYWSSFKDTEIKKQKRKEAQIKRMANNIAKMIKNFWFSMEKFADLKQKNRLEETRIMALNVHLNHIIDKTQTYSSMLTSSVNPAEIHNEMDNNDQEYSPNEDSDDDLTTLLKEEESCSKAEINQEVKALAAEKDIPLDQILAKLPKSYFVNQKKQSKSFSSSSNDSLSENENIDEPDVDTLTPDEDESSSRVMEQQTRAKVTVEYAETSDELTTADSLIPSDEIQGHCLTRVPSLLKHTLREYQHIGLDWLESLYKNNLNGILADEMGLGKTIQTIALLAHLAEAYGDWGPHLIVVPTSVIINWEFEFKKWCPAFKVVSYYGSVKDRRSKRSGWTKDNAFHILITSYKLVVQDHPSFRRMRWHYFVLDEAQNIKNFKSQRWQMLLNLKADHRLLLTGTPIQNSLMELWSLLHFLMPHIFDSHNDFREWFSAPLTSMVEGSRKFNDSLVTRLHKVLRPFLLRRLKKDVEKQMPGKHEHVCIVDLSRRQRFLYDEFMSLSDTKRQIEVGSFMSIMNILMQLRKVCNHPHLFDPRPVISPFRQKCLDIVIPSLIYNEIEKLYDLTSLEFCILPIETTYTVEGGFFKVKKFFGEGNQERLEIFPITGGKYFTSSDILLRTFLSKTINESLPLSDILGSDYLTNLWLNYNLNTKPIPVPRFRHGNFLYVQDTITTKLTITKDIKNISEYKLKSLKKMLSVIEDYNIAEETILYIPKCTVEPITTNIRKLKPFVKNIMEEFKNPPEQLRRLLDPFHFITRNYNLQFPESRWVQYDSGKLQTLHGLLKKLKIGGHRSLIFTQMTKMLDVLETFLSYHGYTYLRLDGTTKVEKRHSLMERFNQDSRIFCFILSTRSGGVGVNLTGADTVIFYDSDWNPTMDAQAQDRCHRIGQTKDVHIYRLVCRHTVEENILKKANQKRLLSQVAIEGGNFTTACFKESTVKEIFNIPTGFNTELSLEDQTKFLSGGSEKTVQQLSMSQMEEALNMVEDESDVKAAKSLHVEVDNDGNEFEDIDEDETEAKEAANAISAELDRMKEETNELEKDSKPIERWCIKVIEDKYNDVYEEELKLAKDEVELAQKELEQNQEEAMIDALAKQLEREEELIENHFSRQDQVPDYIQRALMLPGRAGFTRKSRHFYKNLTEIENDEEELLKLFKKHNKYGLYVASWAAEAERSDIVGETARNRLEELGEQLRIPQIPPPKHTKFKKREEVLYSNNISHRRGRGRPRKLIEVTTEHNTDSHNFNNSLIFIASPPEHNIDNDDVQVDDDDDEQNEKNTISQKVLIQPTKLINHSINNNHIFNKSPISFPIKPKPTPPTVVVSLPTNLRQSMQHNMPIRQGNVVFVKHESEKGQNLIRHPIKRNTPITIVRQAPSATVLNAAKQQHLIKQKQQPVFLSIPISSKMSIPQSANAAPFLLVAQRQQQKPFIRPNTVQNRFTSPVSSAPTKVHVSPLPKLTNITSMKTVMIQPKLQQTQGTKLLLPAPKLRMPVLNAPNAIPQTIILRPNKPTTLSSTKTLQTLSVDSTESSDSERRRSGRSHKPTVRLLQSDLKLLKACETKE